MLATATTFAFVVSAPTPPAPMNYRAVISDERPVRYMPEDTTATLGMLSLSSFNKGVSRNPGKGWHPVGTDTTQSQQVRPAAEGVVMAKLAEIEQLHDGWYGPGSKAVSRKAIDAFRSLVNLFPRNLDIAEIEPMPTPRGGLRMEWDRGDLSFVAELREVESIYLCVIGDSEENDRDAEYAGLDNVQRIVSFYRDGELD